MYIVKKKRKMSGASKCLCFTTHQIPKITIKGVQLKRDKGDHETVLCK